MLSKEAQEVVNVLEELRVHPSTIKYIQECEGVKSLPVDNILNGHDECDEEDFRALLDKAHTIIHGVLISERGGNSFQYYELKKAGYTLWITEQDSFGPLGCAIRCPNADWNIYYG